MDTRKIFFYEIKRTLLSRPMLAFIPACLLYTFFLLKNVVLPGYGGSAPFSPWTFGYFLMSISPLCFGALMFAASQNHSEVVSKSAYIITTTPFPQTKYNIMKAVLSFVMGMLPSFLCIIACLIYYAVKLGFTSFTGLVSPFFLLYLPLAILWYGLALISRRYSKYLFFALFDLIILLNFFGMKTIGVVDINNAMFLSRLTDSTTQISFSAEQMDVISRFIIGGIGLFLAAISCRKMRVNN